MLKKLNLKRKKLVTKMIKKWTRKTSNGTKMLVTETRPISCS